MVYEIPMVVGRRYRRGVRKWLRETALSFTEEKDWMESRFVIKTTCVQIRDELLALMEDETARRVLN